MLNLPTTHGDKLTALLENGKLPSSDRDMVNEAIRRYKEWRSGFSSIRGTLDEKISKCVERLNLYKNFIEIDLIFSSHEDFLYRQKGQLKLDNTVLEEFLPLFVNCIFSDIIENKNLVLGPTTCVSGIRFDSSISADIPGGGIELKQKDQDFAISKKLFIKASHQASFESSVTKETSIAYLACECKTNLDKTMFQEAAATALDLKSAVPSARYLLLCEWLDMTPISSSTTAIDEIIVLRKAKRLGSNERQNFSTYTERVPRLSAFRNYLEGHPFQEDTFKRFINHINSMISESDETEILRKGYF
jgi:hypothetical protein